MTDVDEFSDPALDVVARLLFESLRVRFGEAIVVAVEKRPISTMIDLSAHEMPLLVVTRQSERTELDDDGSDNEIVTLAIEYYASLTPLEKLPLRWPSLRAVWKHCLERLHAGFDPALDNHHVDVAPPSPPGEVHVERLVPMMAALGWHVPARHISSVRYLLTPTQGEAQPCFQALVTIRLDADFDWEFGGTWQHPTIEGVDSVVVASAPSQGPEETQPGYTQEITFD